jgi:4-oxalocrotonate tautomerase
MFRGGCQGKRPMCRARPGSSMAITAIRSKEDTVPLIQVKLIEGVFTAPQRREIVERLSEAMVEIAGESMRQVTWCMVEEVPSGDWGIGGQLLTADDVKALASCEASSG